MATTGSGAQAYQDNTISFPSRARDNTDSLPELSDTKQYTNHDHDNNNNNHARAYMYACAREEIMAAYHDVFGRSMPRFIEHEIDDMVAKGIMPGMVRVVIEYTACAPRPSWAYARAVLLRSAAKGITSDIAFMASLASRGRDGMNAEDYDLPL